MRCAPLAIESLEERRVLSSAAYVTSLYADLLHRDPAPTELSIWLGALAAGESARYVALSFVTSPEYQSDLVQNDYQLLLRRQADAPSLPAWVAAVSAGLRPEQLAANLLASDEYYALQGGANSSWLQGVYQDALGRAIDLSGADYWSQTLHDGVSRQSVALGIVTSPEALTRTVNVAYQDLLRRVPETAGQAFWVNRLEQGQTPAQLLVDIARSPEFVALQGGLDVVNLSPLDLQATTPSPLSGTSNVSWTVREQQNEARAALGHAPILCLGDSITDWFATGAGRPVWNASLASLGAADFAVGGVATSQVLWQVQAGQVAAVSPNVVMLMIGTNNVAAGQSPPAVAEAIAQIVDGIEAQSPHAKILLLGILPRGFTPAEPLRSPISQVNALMALLADGSRVRYLDIGGSFLQRDGTISPIVMSDAVHPTALGYQILVRAIWQPLIDLTARP
jgi:beta-glucosidase